jgi:hypothetical protein
MGSFQDLLNRLRGGEFNYERMGNIPEVKKRTNTILNDPRQMLLNTDANYSNMGSYVPSQMPGAMGGDIDHGITGNMSDIQQMPYRYGDQGGIQQMPYRGGTPTLTEFGQGLEALKKAQESRRDMSTGGLMNEETRRMMNMLQGY